ncbi:helix-turn-helix domain-containing protein [Epibacterium ulvae]|uniref:helix-turn-helix domain-containing protein n=1 Tax=Epibacterium ulvae TaxID=1156985 RepID=UPI001BFCC878|nr:helix-turn-helix domain-containing protein [Epibacterium ulvae]MBT8154310.1 helix-turn-helix domain-containing protein [Epibacterium ulvae]
MLTPDLERHENLKCSLRKRGSSLAKAAEFLKISPTSVTLVSQGFRRSHKIQSHLAAILETTPEALFPERYQEVKEM